MKIGYYPFQSTKNGFKVGGKSDMMAPYHVAGQSYLNENMGNSFRNAWFYWTMPDNGKDLKLLKYRITRKHPLCRYIIGVLMRTTVWDQY